VIQVKTCILIVSAAGLLLGIFAFPATGDPFDPRLDGWYFSNWREEPPNCVGSCDFSWDLYRQAYLGVNPTHDCVEAPLDCAYYEIFKNCASGGNCGGMSLLALALYKYGGYLGFCSPAYFYTGAEGPDRDDLHQAINLFQARQFSASGIENFLELLDSGDLNNAERAFSEVKESLGKGDYPVLSLANSFYGTDAHTVIPYAVEENPAGYPPGTKIMHIWDSNHPYDEDPDHYTDSNPANHLVITSTYNWHYTSGSTYYSGSGWDSAWCFCVPMSKILHKSRQPMALDVLFDALLTAFISGPGAVLSQVSDTAGHRLFAGPRTATEEVWEEDAQLRLGGAFRWPYASNPAPDEPQLLFLREPDKSEAVSLTVDGASYRLLLVSDGTMLEIEGTSARPARDIITLSGSGENPCLQITSASSKRSLSLRLLRGQPSEGDWRGVVLSDLVIGADATISVSTVGDFDTIEVVSSDTLGFALAAQTKTQAALLSRNFGELTAPARQRLELSLVDWAQLESTSLEQVLTGG
jgi:hypothetical protein